MLISVPIVSWVFIFAFPAITMISGLFYSHHALAQYWWNASREPVDLAPDPATTPEAVVQVYGARSFSWRGHLGIHTWIAVKPTDAQAYAVYEVIGWMQRRNN